MECSEIQIPVPWGTVAAKTWGKNTDPLVLTIHGWVDNANSFDPLIPLLPRCFYYVCIDLPGHGRSSPVETSLILRDMDYVIVLKLIHDYFQCGKMTIIAHSMGGFITLMFTQLYPKCVSKIVIFDVFYFYPAPPNVDVDRYSIYYNQRIKFLPKEGKISPEYTKEQIIKRMMSSRLTPLSRKSFEILIERNIEPTSNGKYRITIAQNVKHLIISTIPIDSTVDIMKRYPIKCPHLLILSSNSSFLRFAFRKLHNIYKKNPNYDFHIVDGTHEVHLENPELVAPIVSKFLLKHQNKL